MTRSKFRSLAPDLESSVAGVVFKKMRPKQHKTGSLGWRHNDKLTIKIGDEHVRVQVNVSVTLIGSKAMPKEEAHEPAGTN
jgi:glucose/arabinose dehydrogenase